MIIDWFTVGAQLVNFLILVWLLKRFLYKPILCAITERERKVAEQLAGAETGKAEVEKERGDLQRRNELFQRERQELMRQAAAEAQAERELLLASAREEADGLRAKLSEALARDREKLGREINEHLCKELFALARKALTDLAGANLEECMMKTFLQRLTNLTDAEKHDFARAVQTARQSAIVRSAFELPSAQRSIFANAIRKIFASDLPLEYKTAPGLIAGIEVSVDGHKLAWSFADYLASVEKSVDEFLEEETKAATTR